MPNDTSSETQRIVVLVGLPGSGKSTYLERLGITPLSSDVIRQLLIDDVTDQTIHARVFQCLIGRPATYVDATHLTPAERRPYIDIANRYGCAIEALYFDVPLDVCLARNRGRSRVVPEEAVRAMAAKLVPPSAEEGFSIVTVVR